MLQQVWYLFQIIAFGVGCIFIFGVVCMVLLLVAAKLYAAFEEHEEKKKHR